MVYIPHLGRTVTLIGSFQDWKGTYMHNHLFKIEKVTPHHHDVHGIHDCLSFHLIDVNGNKIRVTSDKFNFVDV